MKKNIVRCCIFGIMLIIFLKVIYNTYCFKYGDGIYSLKKFYELEENQLDVLVLGSSHAFLNINPAVLWDEYGIAAYDLGGSEQPLWNTYYYLREALKTQQPEFIILEAYGTVFYFEHSDDSRIIKNTYGLKFSPDKIKSMEVSVPEERWKEFFFEFMQFHTRYKELTISDFVKDQGNNLYKDWKGFGCNMNTAILEKPDLSKATKNRELFPKSEEYYRKILQLSKAKDIPILVIVSPYAGITEDEQCIYNQAAKIAEEEGVSFYNFNNDYDRMDLDFSKDVADVGHLNYNGNQKFTKYLGKYLNDNFGNFIIDRRADESYTSWERNSEYFQQQLYNQAVKSCTAGTELIRLLDNDNYISVISMKNTNLSKEIIKENFTLLGIEDEYLANSIWILEGNRIIERLQSTDKEYYHVELGKYSDLVVKLDKSEGGGNQIVYNRMEYSKFPYGINVFIYDKTTGDMVDSVWLDTENNLECVR